MELRVLPVTGLPMIQEGDDLALLITNQLHDNQQLLEHGDVIVVAQKIVSKSEGRLVSLASITPSEEAVRLAAETDKDARLVEVILRESDAVVRHKPGVMIMRHRLGHVGAHAGVDQSNIDHGDDDAALLLPLDPDASAKRLREAIRHRSGKEIGVLISDSGNRPWRLGTTGIAIGASGFTVLDDRRGGTDLYGRELKVTLINRADSIATAATLIMGETTERIPVAIVRGFEYEPVEQNAAMINRPVEEDLFL
ncbi:MAG: coenzyme F420-0:L-glutamate ligase [Pseudomonadales bacterium]|nr:coenzyme F420-0:L-glutamate ligase [Pseudomonadales bacterium]